MTIKTLGLLLLCVWIPDSAFAEPTTAASQPRDIISPPIDINKQQILLEPLDFGRVAQVVEDDIKDNLRKADVLPPPTARMAEVIEHPKNWTYRNGWTQVEDRPTIFLTHTKGLYRAFLQSRNSWHFRICSRSSRSNFWNAHGIGHANLPPNMLPSVLGEPRDPFIINYLLSYEMLCSMLFELMYADDVPMRPPWDEIKFAQIRIGCVPLSDNGTIEETYRPPSGIIHILNDATNGDGSTRRLGHQSKRLKVWGGSEHTPFPNGTTVSEVKALKEYIEATKGPLLGILQRVGTYVDENYELLTSFACSRGNPVGKALFATGERWIANVLTRANLMVTPHSLLNLSGTMRQEQTYCARLGTASIQGLISAGHSGISESTTSTQAAQQTSQLRRPPPPPPPPPSSVPWIEDVD